MTALSEGKLTTVIHLGTITRSDTEPTRVVGQQLTMDGLNGLIYVTPVVAKQWIEVLTEIAEGNNA